MAEAGLEGHAAYAADVQGKRAERGRPPGPPAERNATRVQAAFGFGRGTLTSTVCPVSGFKISMAARLRWNCP